MNIGWGHCQQSVTHTLMETVVDSECLEYDWKPLLVLCFVIYYYWVGCDIICEHYTQALIFISKIISWSRFICLFWTFLGNWFLRIISISTLFYHFTICMCILQSRNCSVSIHSFVPWNFKFMFIIFMRYVHLF